MTLKKNSSTIAKDIELLTVFKAHFRGHLNLARIGLICFFIGALCKVKSVNYVKLSAGFSTIFFIVCKYILFHKIRIIIVTIKSNSCNELPKDIAIGVSK
jgi:hypothetical protein